MMISKPSICNHKLDQSRHCQNPKKITGTHPVDSNNAIIIYIQIYNQPET